MVTAALWLAVAGVAYASPWRLEVVPRGVTTLSAVSCSSELTCAAVGGRQALRWNGVRWSIQKPAEPTALTGWRLAGVSCPSAAACFAVGSVGDGRSSVALVERWNGSRWRVQRIAVPGTPQTFSDLTAVSCSSATACTAVGTDDAVPAGNSLIERWNGSTWSTEQAPAGSTELTGVSCTTRTLCTAVGQFVNGPTGFATYTPAALRWYGGSWSLSQVPRGYDVEDFNAVSCPSARVCMIVGVGNNTGSGPPIPLAVRWDGTHWSAPAQPGGGQGLGRLLAVSCSSARSCTATGFGEFGTIAAWNGAHWSTRISPNGVVFSGISCTSTRACVAVGGTAVAVETRS